MTSQNDDTIAVQENDEPNDAHDDSIPISERVRFWEEQDRINQELIPRVIRQHELLTQHIGEHEHMPTLLAKAVDEGLAKGRKEMQKYYDVALKSAKEEMAEKMVSEFREFRSRIGNLVITIATVAGVIIVATTIAINALSN